MLKTIKHLVAVILLAVTPMLCIAPAAYAQSEADVCAGVTAAGGACNDQGPLNAVIVSAINLLSYVVGIVAVVMIIVAGFKYITASGDSNNIASAKNTLIFALIGLVIAASARIITAFVTDKLPG
jgi:ABC-type Fe3+ transport system permease subunit